MLWHPFNRISTPRRLIPTFISREGDYSVVYRSTCHETRKGTMTTYTIFKKVPVRRSSIMNLRGSDECTILGFYWVESDLEKNQSYPFFNQFYTCFRLSKKLPRKNLLTDVSPSFNIPLKVLFPVAVKSVFKAGVPEYKILTTSALFVH